jgi:hypothetical protein
MHGADVRNVTFLKGARWGYPAGYPVEAVDDELSAAADALDHGRRPHVGRLKRSPQSGNYDSDAVDCFFRELEQSTSLAWKLKSTMRGAWFEGFVTNAIWRSEPREGGRLNGSTPHEPPEGIRKRLEQECNEEWERFPELAGTHLKLHRVGSRGFELTRTTDGLRLASCKGALGGRPEYITQIEVNGAIYKRNHLFLPWRPYRWMNIETNATVVRGVGRNFGRRARMNLQLPDARHFWFPVRGTSPANAVMTAVDDDGDRVARYRSARGTGFDVVVAPHAPITMELLLVVAASSSAVSTYFHEISGGGS